ncbi:metallophosphoesterase [Arcanobacterium hippocoleae]|uniref:MPP superfamily phosphohydrolase n=1 Tax=Arcanobacterium hippocoleae TaxID=149017 RepID=A0ABU1T1W8_9ACTO|nr:metallophosphoesterase [Arcanobacterium hippocoleae]MDR6939368.1 putative MPP superfamily phosphohydrolase [Arcanobacterium hippocoleae]
MKWKTAAWLSPMVLGAGFFASALVQAHAYKLRRRAVIIPDGVAGTPSPDASLRILHISDTHLIRTQLRRKSFLRNLSAQNPDLIVLTGDLIAENGAIEPLLQALSAFRGVPGVYVYGSNDYYAPKPKNPLSYLWRNSQPVKKAVPRRLDTARLTAGLDQLGFINLNNATAKITVGTWELEFIGVDDPHIGRARFPELSFLNESSVNAARHLPPEELQTVRIGLTHAPYRRILDQMQEAGCQIVFAGHTHGGQVCLPVHRALVTNCDLPATHASGLFSWPISSAGGSDMDQLDLPLHQDGTVIGWSCENGVEAEAAASARDFLLQGVSEKLSDAHARNMLVQVSAGIGTSPFAQIRTFCPPEAIQIDIMRI